MALPTPEVRTDLGTLYCGDALELIKDVPDDSVDLVFADYPFKVPGGRKAYFNFLKATIEEFKRVLSSNGWLVIINNPTNMFRTAQYLQDMEFKNEVVLVRPHKFCPPGMFCFRHNLMWVLSKKKQKLTLDEKLSDVMEYQNGYRAKGAWHPEAIPSWLAEMMIKATTDEGGLMLDPFAGSGTTLIAAEKLNRRWLGFELNQEYCRIIKERFGRELGLGNKSLLDYVR